MIKKIKLYNWLVVSLLALHPQLNAQVPNGMLSIHFHHVVGNEPLQLDSSTYKNELGQTYTIGNFKYYIGNIRLQNATGQHFDLNDYFLINEDEESTKKIVLRSIPEGKYTSMSFILGVDSIHNCSGAQSGALDPANTMFWAWNSGYIFLKLEGKSSASTAPGKIIEYHVGGYKEPTNCIRSVTIQFEHPLLINSKLEPNIHIKTDIAEILKTPTAIDFSKLPSVTDTRNAKTIAENYKDMFRYFEFQK